MIARLPIAVRSSTPETVDLKNEADVEQKFLYPILTHPSFLGLDPNWVRPKTYMEPTELDKGAGKKKGYLPDYSIWLRGFPLVVVEAKDPSVAIEAALREARLYAMEINKRYPPKVNPIRFIVASNGAQIALSEWDSEAETLIANSKDFVPGSAVLDTFRRAIGRAELEDLSEAVSTKFERRRFHRTSSLMGGQSALSQQLGVNEFAQQLFPVIVKYFGNEAEEASDEIIDRAYVSSNEITDYGGVLETYLKDRVRVPGANTLQPIVTGKHTETGLTKEISTFATNPSFYGRVQLIIGAVGAGKSSFIRRFYRKLMPDPLRDQTLWAFINFNVLPPDVSLRDYVAAQFIDSLTKENALDIHDLENIQKIFAPELRQFERGQAQLLKTADPAAYANKKVATIDSWIADKPMFAECISRHYSGEHHQAIVVVFDNVDRRTRDEQLEIFSAAQWFASATHSLALINLRDTTFDAHRDEPPLDTFVNAINFYIRPPRFAHVIRKRMDLVIEKITSEVARKQEYHLESGFRITYPASRLGEFLLSIYLSLFAQRSLQTAAAIEGLAGKNVRRALGLFADILVSPHIPTTQLTGAAITHGRNLIEDRAILRAAMLGRHKYFNGTSVYVRNILEANQNHHRPSHFLIPDILEFLIRNRKKRIDFSIEGYALVSTIIARMEQLGYDDRDAFSAISTLVEWGLIEPESLTIEKLSMTDAVRVHASGFIHMKVFLERAEYLVTVTPDVSFSSHAVAETIGSIWAGMARSDISISNKARIARTLKDYLEAEYDRRCKRHAFYRDLGYGGRAIVAAAESAAFFYEKLLQSVATNKNAKR